jgi:hypothetical protein
LVNITLFSSPAACKVCFPKPDCCALPPGTVNWIKPFHAHPAGFHWTPADDSSRFSPFPTLERATKPLSGDGDALAVEGYVAVVALDL